MKLEITIPMDDLRDHEVFTHKLDGVFRHFPIGVMKNLAEKYGGICEQIRCVCAPLTDHCVSHIKENMGIEQDRIDRLCDPYLSEPVIAVDWGDGTITIVDGNHRMVKLHDQGETRVEAYVYARELWEKLLLPSLGGDELLTGESDVIERERKLHARKSS